MHAEERQVEARIGKVLRDRDQTLATAESCTGGLIASLVTDVAGASDCFDRGFVTYSPAAKAEMLGVDETALRDAGPVSGPVARQMAAGALERAGTTWAVATTGVAGPSGGDAETPVGTVFVAVAGPGLDEPEVRRHELPGERRRVKEAMARQALEDLLEHLVRS